MGPFHQGSPGCHGIVFEAVLPGIGGAAVLLPRCTAPTGLKTSASKSDAEVLVVYYLEAVFTPNKRNLTFHEGQSEQETLLIPLYRQGHRLLHAFARSAYCSTQPDLPIGIPAPTADQNLRLFVHVDA
jgi:hypothetical protein